MTCSGTWPTGSVSHPPLGLSSGGSDAMRSSTTTSPPPTLPPLPLQPSNSPSPLLPLPLLSLPPPPPSSASTPHHHKFSRGAAVLPEPRRPFGFIPIPATYVVLFHRWTPAAAHPPFLRRGPPDPRHRNGEEEGRAERSWVWRGGAGRGGAGLGRGRY